MNEQLNNTTTCDTCQPCCPNVKIDKIEEGMTGKEVADLLYNNFDKLNKSKANKCVERKVRHLLRGENGIYNETAKNKFIQQVFYTWSKKDYNSTIDYVLNNAPSIEVGTTTTLPAGSQATVTATKDGRDAVLNFGIPKGDKGDQGIKGDSGVQLGDIVLSQELGNGEDVTVSQKGITLEFENKGLTGTFTDNTKDDIIEQGIYKRTGSNIDYNALLIVATYDNTIIQYLIEFSTTFKIQYRHKKDIWGNWETIYDNTNYNLQYYLAENIDTVTNTGIYIRNNNNASYRDLLFVYNYNDEDIKQVRINVINNRIEYRTMTDGTWNEWTNDDYKNTINAIQNYLNTVAINSGNLINTKDLDFIKGYFINNSGVLIANDTYAVTGYIKIIDAYNTISLYNNYSIYNNTSNACVGFYDENKNLIKALSIESLNGKILNDGTFQYIRVSLKDYNTSNYYIGCVNTAATLYIGNVQNNNTIKKYILGNNNSVSGEYHFTSNQFRMVLPTTYIRKNNFLSVHIYGSSIHDFSFGFGYNEYQGHWVRIDDNNIYVYRYINSEELISQQKHNIQLTNELYANINSSDNTAIVNICNEIGETFSMEIDWFGGGAPFIRTNNYSSAQDFTGYITNSPKDSLQKIRLYGDSYFSYNQTKRWTYYLLNKGYNHNMMSHLPGINSTNMFQVLLNELNYSIPQYIVWCLGMNDDSDTDNTPSNDWKNIITKLMSLCKELGIELILSTIPSVPSKNHEGKNNFVRNSGYRYIDLAKAIETNTIGTWKDGLLDTDQIHPTEKGAKVLFNRVLIDFPEITVN